MDAAPSTLSFTETAPAAFHAARWLGCVRSSQTERGNGNGVGGGSGRSFRLLDLFCCGGGAARGYARAGFAVTGVDIEPQPQFPFAFVRGDALEYLEAHGAQYDAIHASPPCQGYSAHVSSASSRWTPTKGKDEPKLLAATRELLQRTGKPWVMENVMGARRAIGGSLLLCGTMFGMVISRHRLFESSEWIEQPDHPKCSGVAKRFAAERGWEYRDMSVTGKGRRAGTTERWKELMQMDGPLTQHQLAEAIPPAFTDYVGRQLLVRLGGGGGVLVGRCASATEKQPNDQDQRSAARQKPSITGGA